MLTKRCSAFIDLILAFREFTAKTLTKEQRPSIRKVLAVAKQKAAQQPKRAKEKIKQRGLER